MAEKYKDKLTEEQFEIAYKENKEAPRLTLISIVDRRKQVYLYASVASGEIIFSSKDKF